MNLTSKELAEAFSITKDSADLWLPSINKAGVLAKLNSALRWSMYLAEVGHESDGLTRLTENLNYKTDSLISKFGRHRISLADAEKYGRIDGKQKANQPAIANCIYGGAWGLKNLGNRPGTDDPWRFRGQGPIQTTGRANVLACMNYLKKLGIDVDLEAHPELLATNRDVAALSTVWYWDTRHINAFADAVDIEGATKAINGGLIGIKDRKIRYATALNLVRNLPCP